MATRFMTAVISCCSNARVQFLDTQCKIVAMELTEAGTLFYQNSQATYVNTGNSL